MLVFFFTTKRPYSLNGFFKFTYSPSRYVRRLDTDVETTSHDAVTESILCDFDNTLLTLSFYRFPLRIKFRTTLFHENMCHSYSVIVGQFLRKKSNFFENSELYQVLYLLLLYFSRVIYQSFQQLRSGLIDNFKQYFQLKRFYYYLC